MICIYVCVGFDSVSTKISQCKQTILDIVNFVVLDFWAVNSPGYSNLVDNIN